MISKATPVSEAAGYLGVLPLQHTPPNAPARGMGQELPLVLIWGDSHAGRLYPGLKWLQARQSFRLAEYARDACPPIMGAEYQNCQDGNIFVFGQIRKLKPQT